MKILVVMGSPRKGESYKVVQQIEARMHALGEVEFDYLWLREARLGPCSGCHACIRFGEERCSLKDDRAAILARMLAADGIILSTPVYALQVSYLMKILIDELSFLYHRPRLFGKFVMGVASGGGQFDSTLNYLKQNAKAWGGTWVTQVGAPHPDSLTPRMHAKLERQIEQAARRFYQTVQAQRVPAPSLNDLIWFRVWRINARAAKGVTPKDFSHWTEQGWFERTYYTGAPVNPILNLLARGMEKVIQGFMRSVYKGY